MSYILDALKKADAERGQGAAHLSSADTDPFAAMTPQSKVPRQRALFMGIGVLALIVAAVWAWLALRPADREHTLPAASAPPVTAAPVATSSTVEPPPSALVAPDTAAKTEDSPVTAAPAKPPVLPILAKAPPPPIKPRPAAPAASAKAKAVPAPAPAATKKSANPTPALSAAQRAGLPQIAVSGSSYSANPAHRMLIANGQVVKEGQELSPGLMLESIGQRSAVFNQGGTRFNVNY